MEEKLLSPKLQKLLVLSKNWLYNRWNSSKIDIQLEPPLSKSDDGFVLAVTSHSINFSVKYFAKIVPFDIYTILVYNLLKEFSCGPEHFLFVAMKNDEPYPSHTKWSMGIVTAQVAGLTNNLHLGDPFFASFYPKQQRDLLLGDAFLLAFFSSICSLNGVPLTVDRWGMLKSSKVPHRLRILDFSHGNVRQGGRSDRENFMQLWRTAVASIGSSISANIDYTTLEFDTSQLRKDFTWLRSERSTVNKLHQACDDTLAWSNPESQPDSRAKNSTGFVSRLLRGIRPYSTLQSDPNGTDSSSSGEEETKLEVRAHQLSEDPGPIRPRPTFDSFDSFHESQIQLLEEFRSEGGVIRTEIRRFFGWFDLE